MSVLPIVCDNCGAKYRLPESFSGDKAKCKQCGSVIDVAAQKAAAAAPSKPAPSKPAAAAPKAASRPARAGRAEAQKEQQEEKPARAARRSRAAEAAAADDDKPSAARQRTDRRQNRAARAGGDGKKNNSMLLIGGGVGALALIAVIAVMSMGGKDEPTSTDQASADTQKPAASAPKEPAKSAPAETPAAPPASEQPAAQSEAGQSDPAPAADASAKPGEAAAADADKPKAAAPKADDDGEPKEKWERNTTASMADVFDPKTLGDVSWPAEVDDAQKDEVRSLIGDILDMGIAGVRAKPKLVELGYPSVFGILERLRQLNYTDTGEQMTAWELNKLLEEITAGLNAGFVAVSDGEDLDPRKADHNAKTNKAWATLLTRYPDKDSFEEMRKKRLSK
ncbi:MAG: hypothetical protein AB7O97_23570 [Planctomycetota bacterium]